MYRLAFRQFPAHASDLGVDRVFLGFEFRQGLPVA
jgi:hypothetical protein